jgi:D-inositol-3-phosphate glycosyltransferase
LPDRNGLNPKEKNPVRPSPHCIAMISVHSSPIGRLGTQDTGGMSVYIRELARALGERGHRVDIFTRTADGAQPGERIALSENVRLIHLDPGISADAPKTELVPHLFTFFKALEEFRARAGIHYDVVHSHYWLSGQVGILARQAWGVPHVTTFHTLGAVKNLLCENATESETRIAAEHRIVESCDWILVTSKREMQNLGCHYHAPVDKLAVVPCGVNLGLFRPVAKPAARRRIGVALQDRLVLYVGRFAPEKGLNRLLTAVACLKHYPRLRVMIVGGDGEGDPAHRRMRQLCRAAGIDERVTFAGRIDQTVLPQYYSAADLLVLPSVYESFGMVALEALACGTPVVATRVGATDDLIRQEAAGRLVKGDSARALADAIAEVLSQNEQHPEMVRRSVWRYDWSRVAEGVLAVYRDSRIAAGPAIEESYDDAATACAAGRCEIAGCRAEEAALMAAGG